jgi:hypothetical protein
MDGASEFPSKSKVVEQRYSLSLSTVYIYKGGKLKRQVEQTGTQKSATLITVSGH